MKRPQLGPWRTHFVLGCLLLLQVAAWFALRDSNQRVRQLARSGSARERLLALHTLGNRGPGNPLDFRPELMRALRSEDDPRLARFPFTATVGKYDFPEWQLRELLRGADQPDADWWIDYVLQLRKTGAQVVGAGSPLDRQELEWFLDALRGQGPPPAEMRAKTHPQLELVRVFLDSRDDREP